jgi:hypothetical protein
MEWWADLRVQKLNMPYSRYIYGDLYSSCFLPQFMDTAYHPKLKEYKTSRNKIDLYILHDSYLGDGQIKKENFIGVDSLVLSDFRGEGVHFNLNKKKKNILIIECSERTAEWRIKDTALCYPKLYSGKMPVYDKKPNAYVIDLKSIFNPMLNYNLEFNLFDYEFLKPVKEAKAILNFNLFNRVPPDVTLSTDKKYLFLNETVNPNRSESSFWWMPEKSIIEIVYMLNFTNEHYKKSGFDKIYLSIVPNPVSILDYKRSTYNHKLERIRRTDWMHCGFIDVFDVFLKTKKQIYRRDDSHWNSYGIQLWVNQVNAEFLKY